MYRSSGNMCYSPFSTQGNVTDTRSSQPKPVIRVKNEGVRIAYIGSWGKITW